MRKQKPLPANQTLVRSIEELISDYDRPTLVRALSLLKTDLSWQILRAALLKEAVAHNVYVLDNVAKTGSQIEAAYHAGVYQALFDSATSVIDRYVDILENKTAVIENVRPEE